MPWLFTNTCYGNWLPGDPRGSVTSVRDRRPGDRDSPSRIEHDLFATPYEPAIPGLLQSALGNLKGPPISLTQEQASVVVEQFRETCRFKAWRLSAVAVMHNHFHLVIEIEGKRAKRALAELKAWASRALNRRWGRPVSETWWTTGGSTRPLRDDAALAAALRYVLEKQPNPLAVWDGRLHARRHDDPEPRA